MKPFFCIITVVKNNLQGLIATHKSISSQSYKNYYWIVVDGVSNDGSIDYINNIVDGDIIKIIKKDNGIYGAMNNGLRSAFRELSNFDYFIFLNGGDIFNDENVLDDIANCCKLSLPDIIYGNSIEVRGGERIEKIPSGVRNINYGMIACHQAIIYKKEICAGLEYDESYKIAGDYDFTAKCLLNVRQHLYINIPLVVFDTGGLSETKAHVGRSENWRVQKNTLRLNIFKRLTNQFLYLISAFMRNYLTFLYNFIRYK
jgi:putative colanic acid biosynthesis glycosyltransferase